MTLPAIRRRSVVDVFSSSDLHLSRLFSSLFFLSLSRSPFSSIRARVRPSMVDRLIQIQTRSPEFHPLLSFSLSFHLFPPPSCPNHRVFASSVSFYPIGTRVSVRAFVAYRPILSLSISFSPTALRSIPFSLSHRFSSFRSSLDPVTSSQRKIILPPFFYAPDSSINSI